MVENFERRRLRVYVAGPISTGDTFVNVHRAMAWTRKMVQDGLAPYCPHFDAFLLAKDSDISWNAYLEWDLEWVAQSEAVFRLAGASRGGDLEVAHAQRMGIPVFYEDGEHLDELTGAELAYAGGLYANLLDFAAEQMLTGVRR